MASIKYDEFETAFHFVSSGEMLDASAHISRESGRILWRNDDLDFEDPPVPDIEDPNLFATVPHSRDLGLGRTLALEYTAEAIRDELDRVAAMFRRPGAFARFKDLLENRGLIQAWYEFEQAAMKRALIEWAEEEGFSVKE